MSDEFNIVYRHGPVCGTYHFYALSDDYSVPVGVFYMTYGTGKLDTQDRCETFAIAHCDTNHHFRRKGVATAIINHIFEVWTQIGIIETQEGSDTGKPFLIAMGFKFKKKRGLWELKYKDWKERG